MVASLARGQLNKEILYKFSLSSFALEHSVSRNVRSCVL